MVRGHTGFRGSTTISTTTICFILVDNIGQDLLLWPAFTVAVLYVLILPFLFGIELSFLSTKKTVVYISDRI